MSETNLGKVRASRTIRKNFCVSAKIFLNCRRLVLDARGRPRLFISHIQLKKHFCPNELKVISMHLILRVALAFIQPYILELFFKIIIYIFMKCLNKAAEKKIEEIHKSLQLKIQEK